MNLQDHYLCIWSHTPNASKPVYNDMPVTGELAKNQLTATYWHMKKSHSHTISSTPPFSTVSHRGSPGEASPVMALTKMPTRDSKADPQLGLTSSSRSSTVQKSSRMLAHIGIVRGGGTPSTKRHSGGQGASSATTSLKPCAHEADGANPIGAARCNGKPAS